MFLPASMVPRADKHGTHARSTDPNLHEMEQKTPCVSPASVARRMMRPVVALFLAALACKGTASLTPLTQIEPTNIELDAFAATVEGALAKLQAPTRRSTVHILGASATEAAVDWSRLCESGHTLVLVGPKVAEVDGGAECVTTIAGLYSRELVRTSPDPDALVLLNADLYMCEWRRTLAELLQRHTPIVLTIYCEYEGAAMDRLLRWPEVEFAPAQIAQCDDVTRQIYGSLGARTLDTTDVGRVPDVRTLWPLAPNPHAHAAPKESGCRADSEAHGVRNAYWMAFAGAAATGGKSSKSEL